MGLQQNNLSFTSTFRVLNQGHPRDHVVLVLAFARQEFQVSQEALDPRDQLAFRVHPVVHPAVHLAPKDPRDHEETKVTQANKEAKAPQAPRDLQGQ